MKKLSNLHHHYSKNLARFYLFDFTIHLKKTIFKINVKMAQTVSKKALIYTHDQHCPVRFLQKKNRGYGILVFDDALHFGKHWFHF